MSLSYTAETNLVSHMNHYMASEPTPDPKEKEKKAEEQKTQKPDLTQTKPQIPKWY